MSAIVQVRLMGSSAGIDKVLRRLERADVEVLKKSAPYANRDAEEGKRVYATLEVFPPRAPIGRSRRRRR